MGLSDIGVKLDRAKKHLGDLEAELDRFVSEKPHPLHVVTHNRQSAKVWDMEWTRKIPSRWSAIAGDCAHNLRCVLDHIVWDLSGGAGNAPDDSEFPVFRDPLKYFRSGKDGKPLRGTGLWKIRGVKDDIAHAAFEGLQPFEGQDPTRHPLWIIHELDRLDKHRALHVVWGRAHDYASLLANGIGDESDLPPGWRKLKVGATQSPFYRAETPPGTKTQVKTRFDLAIRVTLPPGTVGSHENLDVLLGSLIAFVEAEVLSMFTPFISYP